MNAIIFGANGQDGAYLKELLEAEGVEVIATSRSGAYIHADVSSFEDVSTLVERYKPAYVFHLAANSTTRHEAVFDNHAAISTGTLNILETVKKYAPDCKVFLSGSGLQFRNTGRPIKETDEFEASSAYAVSRIQSVYAARYYRTLGLKVYVGYFFTHDSPLRPERHMSNKIAMAASRIAKGSNEKLTIGDISVKKEWGFAGDIVRGVWCLVNQDKVHEATIGTGEEYSIEDWLDLTFGLVNQNWREHVVLNDNFVPEYKILVSDPSTIKSLGWTPRYTLESLAKMMLSK